MIAVVLSGFIVAVLLLIVGKYLRGQRSMILALLPGAIFFYLLSLLSQVTSENVLRYRYPWIPSMEVNLDLRLDGLSLLFGLIISGIGTLVFIYAASYLKANRYLNRFFAYLCVFMGSMLGLVFADNIILLFIFWELTSISSFFLIGFDNAKAEARKSALLALAITGGGGFFLLAGFVLMAGISDSYSFEVIRQSASILKDHSLFPLLVFLLLAGAFTKSAQFPFHFWLPQAMSAPTPVSAYLHSATMVKAGVYLLARFTPVLGDAGVWNIALMIGGSVTMLYGAVHSILRTDLKAVLAYSTVSALGVLVFLIGIGTEAALIACVVFIVVHALYKAALFLITGTLEHETGTRDVTQLRGLGKLMLPMALAGILAAFSGGGIPFTFGFVGKELIYEATLQTNNPLLLTTLAVLTNILLLCAACIAGLRPFLGRLPASLQGVHSPPALLWLPPLILSLAGVGIGISPEMIGQWIVEPAVVSMHHVATPVALKRWHGFNFVVLLSAITIAAGMMIYVLLKSSHGKEAFLFRYEWLAPERMLARITDRFSAFSLWYTRLLQNGYLRSYVMTIIVFLICIVSYRLFSEVNIYMTHKQWSEVTGYEGLVFVIMTGAIFKTISTASRLTAIVSMSVVGYCVCLLFVLFSAPDLAMTQFAIDTLTIVLFVLVLLRLPPFIRYRNTVGKLRDGLVSLSFGSLIAIIALQVLNEPTNKAISRFYADHAYLEAKGKNVVNVILVDFRGLDTLIEITVLAIAAIGVYSLLKLRISKSEKE
jgi:multicomponent Na+:H+ antiporter subunit A